jgi:hypothetical protein
MTNATPSPPVEPPKTGKNQTESFYDGLNFV